MSNKLIIISICFFLFVSFVFLSLSERKQADINNKNVWMLYFENSKDNSLNFAIENHSTHTNFHWQLLIDKIVTKEGETASTLGVTKTIPVSLGETAKGKMTISVTTDNNEKKEIYKNF